MDSDKASCSVPQPAALQSVPNQRKLQQNSDARQLAVTEGVPLISRMDAPIAPEKPCNSLQWLIAQSTRQPGLAKLCDGMSRLFARSRPDLHTV